MDDVVLNPGALRGLAHPLRVRLLGLLRERGPSTASKLAELLGQSSGATSYHLRQLEAHGFVEDVPDRGSGRERWWRAAHRSTTLDAVTGRADVGAAEGYLRATVSASFQLAEAVISELATMPRQWQDVASFNDTTRRLTPAQAAELRTRIRAVLDDYPPHNPEDDDPADGSERVSLQWNLLPLLRDPGRP
ncbi:winged helix-turn-helix domain-containing protein [Winogradskya humida]|uniref:Transcriptional regulator n=1 Tax=Winogradskya humida TaxID=113566 RepID=A0ABQ3ZQM6_9ACTN|nr:winged helix-turn-helix domain-containing protein [Actinoplanes humidus]GIE20884.1 transcriptional regulator [Actinoplanes humidus]